MTKDLELQIDATTHMTLSPSESKGVSIHITEDGQYMDENTYIGLTNAHAKALRDWLTAYLEEPK